MNKTLTALAAAAALAVVAVGAPSDAQARWRGGGGAVAAGIIGGLAAGAIIGSAVAPRYYEPAPVYVAPPPATCIDQQYVWSPRRGDYVLRNVRVPC